MGMSEYPATREQIVRTFLAIPYDHMTQHNWGTAPMEHRAEWEVGGTDTYINGIILTVDMDYIMGWLIECVEHSTSVVSYLIVVTFPGSGLNSGPGRTHDSMMYEGEVGTFFERNVHSEDAAVWALPRIYGLVEEHSTFG